MPILGRRARRLVLRWIALALCTTTLVGLLTLGSHRGAAAEGVGLVISELVTGGASATDEFVEIYNPAASEAPLAGVELVYVTASGSTVTRRAAWEEGSVPAYGHLLIGNAAGIYETVADETYSGGMSSTGGSVVLRVTDSGTAIDALGWGNATNSWVEGTPAVAAGAGSSLERLPGGRMGSAQDTDDNLRDFVERQDPEPENSASEPTPPGPAASSPPTPLPTTSTAEPTPGGEPSSTAEPTGTATDAATQSPAPSQPASADATPTATTAPSPTATVAPPASIAAVRSLPDGARATIEGLALTGSTFTDGGGYIWDGTAGIAVLVTGAAFERGEVIRASGEVDDRYHQRTLRAEAIEARGSAVEPHPEAVGTGSVGEAHEAELVVIEGEIVGSPDELSAGRAFEIDDGSGAVRVLVVPASEIDTSNWSPGSRLRIAGVVGQRDSSGSGAAGYRVIPRDQTDVQGLTPAASPSPSPSPSPSASPGAQSGMPTPRPTAGPGGTPDAGPQLVSIAEARRQPSDASVRIRGVVTAPTGLLLDAQTAVVQDDTGALLLRVSGEIEIGARGQLVELVGVRSTKSGMLTVRVASATGLGPGTEPDGVVISTATATAAGEDYESRLVRVRGIVSSVRLSSAGNTSFEIDDGSGPLRGFVFASTGIETGSLTAGAWVEIRGVLGQETTGDRPDQGYRVWPRDATDLRIVAPAVAGGDDDAGGGSSGGGSSSSSGSGPRVAIDQDLDTLLVAPGESPREALARATLVTGAWPELELAGVIWDGTTAIGLADKPPVRQAVELLAADTPPPFVVEVMGSASPGALGPLEGWLLDGEAPDVIRRASGSPAAAATDAPASGPAIWARLVGVLERHESGSVMQLAESKVNLSLACADAASAALWLELHGSAVVAHGLLGRVADRLEFHVPCAGVVSAPRLEASIAEAETAGQREVGPADARPAPAGDGRGALLIGAAAITFLLTSLVGVVAWRRGTFARLLATDPEPTEEQSTVGRSPV